jgi:hypothetical protein
MTTLNRKDPFVGKAAGRERGRRLGFRRDEFKCGMRIEKENPKSATRNNWAHAFLLVGVWAGGIRIIRLGGTFVFKSPSHLSSEKRGLQTNSARGNSDQNPIPFRISPGQARPNEIITALG